MALPGEDPRRPGPQPLFPGCPGAVVAAEIADLLRMLGQAANDAALAVLDAQVQFARVVEASWRYADEPNLDDALQWATDELVVACRDHVERLTAVYGKVAARYATLAVDLASRVADGGLAIAAAPLHVAPSDVLDLAQIHVPLLQIPARAVPDRSRRKLARENAALAEHHQQLVAAMAAVQSPSIAFDEPDKVAERQTADLLEADFPAALHSYATSCAFALAMMAEPGG